MRVLIIGAGVIGSFCAARLRDGGLDVTLLARGRRLAELREHGVVLESALGGRRTVTRVPLVGRLDLTRRTWRSWSSGAACGTPSSVTRYGSAKD